MALLQYLTRTYFDFGAVAGLAAHLDSLKISRPLLCTDKGIIASGLLDKVRESEPRTWEVVVFDGVPANPTEAAVLDAVGLYRESACDGIIALGGGSSIDLAKGVALLATHPAPLSGYAAVSGGVKKIGPCAPVIAIPTTAGTGSEVSVGTVIIVEDGRKLTIVSPHVIPKLAICDPDLTLGLPPALTAATGMDAVTHCVEAFLSRLVDPPAEAIALDGLRRAIGQSWLKRAVSNGADREARWNMMMASTEGALAFIKGLGAVHSMSHAVGRLPALKAHHGTLNAVILPTVLRFNDGHVGDKYGRLREAMGLAPTADLASEIESLNASIGLPANLSDMGVTKDMIPGLAEQALADLSTMTTPRKPSLEDYAWLFEQAMV
jgi:4-hydroxybutyrate dehydrogenase